MDPLQAAKTVTETAKAAHQYGSEAVVISVLVVVVLLLVGAFITNNSRSQKRFDKLQDAVIQELRIGDGNGAPSLQKVMTMLGELSSSVASRLGTLESEVAVLKLGAARDHDRIQELHGLIREMLIHGCQFRQIHEPFIRDALHGLGIELPEPGVNDPEEGDSSEPTRRPEVPLG